MLVEAEWSWERAAAFFFIRGDLRSVGVSSARPRGPHSVVCREGVVRSSGFAGCPRSVVLFVNGLLNELEPLELLRLCPSLSLLFFFGRKS